MKIKRNLVAKIAFTSLFTIFLCSMSYGQQASSVVSDLYKAHKTKSVAAWNKVQLKKYFAPVLANAIYKVARKEGGIGFDILYNTQNTPKITAFKVDDEISAQQSNGQNVYEVLVTFRNLGKNEKLTFTINSDLYKIEDISYFGLTESLMQMINNVMASK